MFLTAGPESRWLCHRHLQGVRTHPQGAFLSGCGASGPATQHSASLVQIPSRCPALLRRPSAYIRIMGCLRDAARRGHDSDRLDMGPIPSSLCTTYGATLLCRQPGTVRRGGRDYSRWFCLDERMNSSICGHSSLTPRKLFSGLLHLWTASTFGLRGSESSWNTPT